MHPMLITAVKAARRASAIINRASLELDSLKVAQKGHSDYVTDIDQAAEEAIIDVLKTAYPDHAFLAEESTDSKQLSDAHLKIPNLWIIDPIDGTTNFIHGFPYYSISIALMQYGQVNQALVFDPTQNELFTATRGAGAFLNDKRIRVSRRIKLHESIVGSSYPPLNGAELSALTKVLAGLTAHSSGFRRNGSAALDLANVAAGRLDGHFAFNIKPWDFAAGSLLVQEAGGLIADFNGEQTWLRTGNLVSGTSKIFPQLLQVVEPLTAI